MKKFTLPLLLGALIVTALIWIVAGPSGAPDLDPTDPTRFGDTGEPDELSGTRIPDEERSPDRRHVDERRADRRSAGGTITIRGRCVTAENKLPLSGCEVQVASVRSRFGRNRLANTPTTDAKTVFTQPDGRFEVELELASQHHVRLRTKMNGRADMQGFLPHHRGVATAGNIEIPTGVRFVARVVSKQDIPQPGVGFRFYRAVTGGRPTVGPLNWLNYESDEFGAIETEVMLASGSWNVTPQGSVKILEPGRRFEIPADAVVHEMKFVVELPDPKTMISGRLVDATGRGVPHISIHATDGSKWPVGYGTSDPEGMFQVRCRTKPNQPVYLAVPRATGFETLQTAQTYAWGSTDVTLTLERASNLTLIVTEDGGDQPIEDYKVVWYQMTESGVGGHLGGRRVMAHHPGGEILIEGVPAGRIKIVVAPKGKTYAPNEPYEFKKPLGDHEIRINLGRRVELPVLVVDGTGKPLAGSRLELVRSSDDKPVTLNSHAIDHSLFPQFARPGSYVLMLDNVVTDKNGAAVIRWVAADATLAIRALGPGHVPMVHQPVAVAETNRVIKIVVNRGASLTGTITPLTVLERLRGKSGTREFTPQAPSISLVYRGTGGPSGVHRTKSSRVDDKGQFRILGLHPGRWDVSFRVWRRGAGRSAHVSQKKFPPIQLRGDEDRRVTFDIDDMRPSTLTGQVFLNGIQWAQKKFVLTRVTINANGRVRSGNALFLTTDARGSFRTDELQPGLYRIGIDGTRNGNRPSWVLSATNVEVPPGGSVDRVFRIESGKLRVRLVDKNRKGVPKQHLTIQHKKNDSRSGAATGLDGWMEIDPIGTGVYTIGMYPPIRTLPGKRLQSPRQNQEVVLGEVRVTAGTSASEVTFTMPEFAAERSKRP